MSDPLGKKPRQERVDADCVYDLSTRMMKKLRQNCHKAHWDTVTNYWLLARLNDEVRELQDAMMNDAPELIADECADVANFAAMIADNITKGKG